MENLERSLFFKPDQPKKEESLEELMKNKENFREFLKEQISLPSSLWDFRFKEYLQLKINEKEKIEKESSFDKEQEKEKTFQRYLKYLDLEKETLKNKTILDLGCGEEGEFVLKAREEGLNVFGVDIKINPEKFPENLRSYFFKENFEEKIPLKNLDMILALASIFPIQYESEASLKKILENCLNSLKENGEMRVYPIGCPPKESELKSLEEERKRWLKVLEELSLKEKIQYQLIPIDINVSGKKPDVWLNELLIIKSNPEK
ncbi:MAG: hypothetical protein AB7D02_02225 [Candidatus Paceibacterota bacterium]